MISFPNAKINIGLHITEKRSDGFHDLETVMYPVPLTDALEFVESGSLKFESSGLNIDGTPENNLVLKAYHLLKEKFDLPPIHIHLHKNIPMGAGLGGGSSNAAFMLKMLNGHFKLKLPNTELENFAAQLGSDCAFFINNQPVYAYGRGELMEPVTLLLSELYILLVKPPFGISTKEAYNNVVPQKSRLSLKALVDFSLNQWKPNIKNQFEKTLFPAHPEIAEIKEKLYKLGATYASMTGSGSAVYGLFRSNPERFVHHFPSGYFSFASHL
ncbi:MAG: 4-(cytidine 5'-diphospho)-2-C-methyl-D-erythritol kinase [Bacteroidetes bacterium GWF2_42_66]|nr:MAG: 4-(cytidine 5'-diphospho)-2-C-methyl-D-erythritol kinase [Bacteroidetes bacterium GWA2_42_15]OFX97249.1 MAG: 4-(cytidine 5'-diphospho)-2-C-methyl-D-erythritol kinase [Bacteroidetes bacterium GWE2_42_39]OFY39998.1 MAG: 4-(cytidine 5'-diphospho)-2-C-methyl-D-erythritol kinase [Bacteroidetes bacterium GWF2_42_66]HBL78061.1 4-(cytidine 5'-diphospho)-2-C-methyl-D-erythritol kinase [Prolixibacteraceae bacterium]HCU61239.1 4-(cytidine 5'-diphospho)-2-C-methyl-D-erythritol kinase [Prolixibacter